MLYWTIALFVVALAAALLGFTGLAGNFAGIARIIFFAFLIIGIASLLLGRRAPA